MSSPSDLSNQEAPSIILSNSANTAAETTVRTLEQISEQTARLQHLKADSLSIVIKPDGETELYLELRLKENHIEARVELHRGDFAGLSSHWGDLEDKLNQQGVRLAPLTQEDPSSWTDTQDQSRSHKDPLAWLWETEMAKTVTQDRRLKPQPVLSHPVSGPRGLEIYA